MKYLLAYFIVMINCSDCLSLQVKLNSQATFYVVMVDSVTLSAGVSGILNPPIYRTNGSTSLQITNAVWTEIDATNMRGLYSVGFSPTIFTSPSEYIIIIASPTCADFRKTIDVVANLESDSVIQIQTSSGDVVNYVAGGVMVNTNLDKDGYTGTLTEKVTCYSNLDKTNYQLAAGQEVRTSSVTAPVVDAFWLQNLNDYTGSSAGYYVLKGSSSENGRDWTEAEKGKIKSSLTIEGSTPTWRLDMIDRDIRIFR